jgi:hypothetical protein
MKWIAFAVLLLVTGPGCDAKKEDAATKPAAGPDRAPPPPVVRDQIRDRDPVTEPPPPSVGIPECDRYVAAVAAFRACDQVAPVSRDAIQTGLDRMKTDWAAVDRMTPEARQMNADACTDGVRALLVALEAAGCPAP